MILNKGSTFCGATKAAFGFGTTVVTNAVGGITEATPPVVGLVEPDIVNMQVLLLRLTRKYQSYSKQN